MAFIVKRILIIVVSLALILPLAYSFYYKISPEVDAATYDSMAMNIVEGYGFIENRGQGYEFDTSIVRAGPAYEFFLAGIYKIFGHNYAFVWVWQALLHALSAWLLYLIAKAIFQDNGESIGLLASGIFGLHPDLVEISAMVMTETLYLFLIILAIWLFVKVYESPHKAGWSAPLALVTVLAILSRPPVALFVPVFLVFYFFRRDFRAAAVFLVIIIAALTPWTIRNYSIYHSIIPTTMIGSYNLWVGNTLTSDGGQISGGFNPATDYASRYGYFNFAGEAKQQFKNFVLENPRRFLSLTATRFVRYFSLIRPMGFWFYQSGWPQLIFISLSGLFIALLFWGGIAGLWLLFSEKHPWRYYLLVFALASPLVLLPTVVQSRYRFQVYPFFALAFGYLIVALWNKKSLARKFLFSTAVFLLIVTIIDFSLFWPVVAGRLSLFF